MSILYINSSFRDGSRTAKLAERYLKSVSEDIVEFDIGKWNGAPLDPESLRMYNDAVKNHCFDDPFFDEAKQFAAADEIVISAPYWNLSIPAKLHDYIERVCTQGVTFDIGEDGSYHSLVKAKKLTFITTAGGYIENDHAFRYIEKLCKEFFEIDDIGYIKAEGLDIIGNDVEKVLNDALK